MRERKEHGWTCRLVDVGWVLSLAGTVTLGKLFNLFVWLPEEAWDEGQP